MYQSSQKPPNKIVHHEWRNIENSAAYFLPRFQSLKESNPHLKLLDVGAGSGTISATFAKAIPDGHVTATDLKEDILPRARANAESIGVSNIEFQQADVFKLPFADGTFDVTHCHQMLTHLKTPEDAIREMLRVTKPGGIVAAREGDLETEAVWPALPELRNFHNLAANLMKAGGGTSTGGRELLSWALKAGVPRDNISVSSSTWCYSTTDEKKVWAQGLIDMVRGGRARDAALKLQLGTEDELEKMAKAWEEWSDKDESTLSMMHGEVIIVK